ncbi:MAG TPA: hypothetical protein VLJ21_02635 [Candidatus Binatia bacterium]|nr:hypothetical protein [Candidatus Binatia bacterium]
MATRELNNAQRLELQLDRFIREYQKRPDPRCERSLRQREPEPEHHKDYFYARRFFVIQ